jgi:MOB kinase activator 1
VRLPVGEDLCEWLAVNTVDFYNAINVLFGTLEEFCTVHSCSLMTAGPKVSSAAAPTVCGSLNV